MQRDAVNAVPDLGFRVRDIFRPETAVDGLPALTGIVGSEGARGRYGDEHSFGIDRIQENRVQYAQQVCIKELPYYLIEYI